MTPVFREQGIAVDGWTVPVAAVVGAGAAVLPDFDHHNGTIARSIGPVSEVMARAVGFVFGGHRNGTHSLVGIAVFTGIASLFTHLGGLALGLFLAFLFAISSAALRVTLVKASIGHTLLCLAAGALLARGALMDSFNAGIVPWAVALGTAVHLLGDMATVQGCPLLWPFHRHRYNYASLSTDHAAERYLVAPVLTVAMTALIVGLLGGFDELAPVVADTWAEVSAYRPW
jgi:membrane-bound metal-dependent hydrolase YbcI (DUF457 family)